MSVGSRRSDFFAIEFRLDRFSEKSSEDDFGCLNGAGVFDLPAWTDFEIKAGRRNISETRPAGRLFERF